jgi:hypothetical protein
MRSALAFLEGSPVQPWRQHALRVCFALWGLALIAVTWRLWTPQDEFPQVPLVVWAGWMPEALQWSTLAIVVISLVAIAAGNQGRSPYLVFAACVALLVLIDQHRLQPWAFQFALFAVVLAAMPPPRAFVLLRWLTVSIYLWSAVAKLDATFVNTLGQQFLAALVGLGGISSETWSAGARTWGALAFPLGEIIVGIGLALPLDRSAMLRRIVLALVVAMHAALILLLSPLGLAHQPAVLLWNGWFIVQAVLLFGFPAPQDERAAPSVVGPPSHWVAELAEVAVEMLVLVVMLLPVLNLADRYDHWLAWGLYAPRNSRALLFVPRDHVATFAPKYRKYLHPQRNEDWVQWRLDNWSLDSLAVPLYPQDRFQLGVAEAVIAEQHLEGRFRIVLESPADRWTGRRKQQTITDLRALHQVQDSFYFNARPQSDDSP